MIKKWSLSLFSRWLARLAARHYLGKPELEELIAIKYRRPRTMLAGLLNEAAYRIGSRKSFKLITANIEVTNSCNLSCSMCAVNRSMKREKVFMDESLFRKIIDENPGLDFILPFQWGEPLLHPKIFDFIRYAGKRGIRSMLTTNGTLLDDRRVKEILECSLERITISVDGMAGTFEKIRGFPYEELKSKVLALKRRRDEAGSALGIDVSLVVFEETEKEAADCLAEWKGIADRVQAIPRFVPGERVNPCRELWRGGLVVLSDGRVTPCCADYDGELIVGDGKYETLGEIWNGRRMQRLRKSHSGRDFTGICKFCSEYRTAITSPRFS